MAETVTAANITREPKRRIRKLNPALRNLMVNLGQG